MTNSQIAILELHGFADASSRTYGAVVYVRLIAGREVRVNLFCSKSRVAPLRQLSIHTSTRIISGNFTC